MRLANKLLTMHFAFILVALTIGCGSHLQESSAAASASEAPNPIPQSLSEAAPPATQTGGFDGQQAFDFTAKLVGFGPRPPASDAIRHTQDYLLAQLKAFGCTVDEDNFNAQTPIGTMAMKNIVAKVPGTGQGIILLLTHYDTLRLDNFVGADDGGSSTGLLLEMAKLLCARPKQPNAVWLAFLDGEEAQVVQNGVAQWTSTDSVYGSRELAARLALSGDLNRVRAVLLADMIGPKNLRIEKDSNSAPWLTDLVWSTAAKLGYRNIFVSQETAIDDDHMPFVHRQVPSVDVIDLNDYSAYWHTTQDTLDKISPRSLAIVGQVFLVSISELQKKFH